MNLHNVCDVGEMYTGICQSGEAETDLMDGR